MLNGLAGVLIFFNIVSGICGDKGTEPIGKKSRRMLIRMPLMTLFYSLSAYLFFIVPSNINYSTLSEGGKSQWNKVWELLGGIIPDNAITPFVEKNLLQILILAIAFGMTLSTVRNRYPELVGTVSGMNYIVTAITVKVCKLIPVFVFCSLLMIINSPEAFKTLNDLWKPVVMFLVISIVSVAAAFVALSVRYKCKSLNVLRTIFPAFIICLATGSPVAGYSTNVDIMEKDLGVSKRFSRVGLSIGGKICSPGLNFYLAVMVIYFAEKYHVDVNIGWVVTAVFLTFLLTFVCPPVPGALLVIFGILSKQLGFPDECMVLIATADVILDGLSSGVSCLLRNVELLFEAGKYGELDDKALKKI